MHGRSREGTFDRSFQLSVSGLVFAILAVAGTAGSSSVALAAGDGISTQLANELKALSATNAQSAGQPQQKAAKKTKRTKVAAKTSGKQALTKKSAAGRKVKLTAKSKSPNVAAKTPGKSKPKGGTKVASVSAFVSLAPIRRTLAKKGGTFKGNVSWQAPSGCVPGALKSVLYQVSEKFGPVVVLSSMRGQKHNRRVGGARKSWHLKCMATDFRVRGSTKGLWAFLRSNPNVGGLHRYPSGFYHIDLGPKRTW